MGTHTYEQTVKYEVARDLLSSRVGDISDQIAQEEAKASPNAAAIAQIEQDLDQVYDAIAALDVTDDAQVAAVIAANKRTPLAL